MRTILMIFIATILPFTTQAVATNHIESKVFKAWVVTSIADKRCHLENFTGLKNTVSLRSKKKIYDTSELRPVEIYLHFSSQWEEFPVAVHARSSLKFSKKNRFYHFGKKVSFSIDKGTPFMFKRRYKPFTFAFRTAKGLDALVIDMKKGVWGQLSGPLFTKNNQELIFEGTVDLRGFTKAWNMYEECIKNVGVN